MQAGNLSQKLKRLNLFDKSAEAQVGNLRQERLSQNLRRRNYRQTVEDAKGDQYLRTHRGEKSSIHRQSLKHSNKGEKLVKMHSGEKSSNFKQGVGTKGGKHNYIITKGSLGCSPSPTAGPSNLYLSKQHKSGRTKRSHM